MSAARSVLIIGLSRVVRKRVLPALLAMPEVSTIHIASQSSQSESVDLGTKRGEFFASYQEALRSLSPAVAYISLPNSLHYDWANKALANGFHAIVDKPAFTSLEDCERLLKTAEQNRLCLAESIVWNFHSQVETASREFDDAGIAPLHLNAVFTFPPIDARDFRNNARLGGGSLFDLGPYAVSCGRVFFKSPPQEVLCRIHSRGASVDTSFSAIMSYSEGRSMTGYFGFQAEYKNELSIFGSGLSVGLDRVFSMPADMKTELRIRKSNQSSTKVISECDSFEIFLREVFAAIDRNDWRRFSEMLREDGQNLYRLRASAGLQNNARGITR